MSDPPEISRMNGAMEGSFSRVMTIGGLGLFFDPGGLPLGRRATSTVPPSSAEALGFLEGAAAAEVGGREAALSASSESLWWKE